MSRIDEVNSILRLEEVYCNTDTLLRGVLVALVGILEELEKTNELKKRELQEFIDETI